MRKTFILAIAILFSCTGFAQRIKNVHEQPVSFFDPSGLIFQNDISSARTTAAGDTFTLSHIPASDTIELYTVDSGGYVTGTNFWGDKAFAERYDFNDSDSSMQVLGVFALFGGSVNPASAQTINFNIWSQSYPQPITDSLIYNGFPNNILDYVTVPVTQLGIGATTDTLKKFWFTAPTTFLSGSFFAGYSINYTFDKATGKTINGDNIGIACSKNGERIPAGPSGLWTLVYNTGFDTTLNAILNVQNATLGADNVWYDNYTQNDSLKNNLAIYPIVVIGNSTTGVSSITKNNLTFYGNYPNPAVNYTNIRFSLAKGADVTLEVMDMNGRLIEKIQQNKLAAGEHIIPVSTANLPAGDYLYLLRTSGGDGIAGKMSKNP